MSFHEEVFPIRIAYGANGGPKFKTTVLELGSGFEKRNADWSHVRGEYDVAYGLKTQEELDEIRDFFMARRGRMYGFRFRDWQDYKLEDHLIGVTDGATTTFQAFKRYQSGAVYYDRKLHKLEQGTVSVKIGTTPVASSVDHDTGEINVSDAAGAAPGEPVLLTCQFHIPVRFDTDHIATTLEDYNVYSWGQIVLLELRL